MSCSSVESAEERRSSDQEQDQEQEQEQAEECLSYRQILVPTLLYFTLVFALYPLQIQIIIQAICDNKGSDDDEIGESDDGDCDSAAISSRAAIINTYCSIALYFPTIFLTGENTLPAGIQIC